MTPLVVDASVVAKWFIPESGADRARELLSGRYSLHAPDLLWTEIASVAWKLARKGTLDHAEAVAIVSHAPEYPVETHPSEPLLPSAMRLALLYDRTVYDCLYLALSIRENAPFVTEDAKLARSLKGDAIAKQIVLLSDQ